MDDSFQLRYNWIDGQQQPYDPSCEYRYLSLFAPSPNVQVTVFSGARDFIDPAASSKSLSSGVPTLSIDELWDISRAATVGFVSIRYQAGKRNQAPVRYRSPPWIGQSVPQATSRLIYPFPVKFPQRRRRQLSVSIRTGFQTRNVWLVGDVRVGMEGYDSRKFE
ncbi:hypothetical protein M413DRAFT_33131 [Hebeloma cylindrosporum]|uniref:Uncharacterized protein n=1 Tax=Hebeloma cylindrosporum TaxID=76867 RepID=A0A0C2X9G5_HEBCY|nr:hypothetical protein M413DRAFT_33131 [Hebeloma cylindrosporum h7]